MDSFKSYLSRLRKGLSRINPPEQDDIIEEIQSHIEDALHDPKMGKSEEERMGNIMSELGNPEEITNDMSQVHGRYGWLDVILLLAIFPAFFAISILMRHSKIQELQHLINLLMFLGMILIVGKRKSPVPEGWYLSWTTIYIMAVLYGSIKLAYKGRLSMRSRPNFITFEYIPIWLKISLLSIFLIFALSFLIRRIWLSRRDGLSIFFLLFPITYQVSSSIEYIAETTRSATNPNTSSFFWLGFIAMIIIAIQSITFACALTMSERSKRWYSLTIGMTALGINYAIGIILFSNASLAIIIGQITLSLSGLFTPLIIGLATEYRHTGRNPLIPIRS